MSGNSYEGKTVVLTGANGAIGTETAKLLADRGAEIFAVDVPGTDWTHFLDQVGHEDRVATAEADVTQEDEVKAYVAQAVERFGKIDLFFNNAGIEGGVAELPELDMADLEKVFQVNVKGVALGLKYVLPVMYGQGSGAVVNASSVAGLTGSPGMTPYIASKHAVLGITRTAALEAGSSGVRVNCVNPGPIDGKMMDRINTNQGDRDKMHDATKAAVPLGRYGAPKEVAGLVAFLGSDDASFCNGNFYTVDGGMMAA